MVVADESRRVKLDKSWAFAICNIDFPSCNVFKNRSRGKLYDHHYLNLAGRKTEMDSVDPENESEDMKLLLSWKREKSAMMGSSGDRRQDFVMEQAYEGEKLIAQLLTKMICIDSMSQKDLTLALKQLFHYKKLSRSLQRSVHQWGLGHFHPNEKKLSADLLQSIRTRAENMKSMVESDYFDHILWYIAYVKADWDEEKANRIMDLTINIVAKECLDSM